MPFRRERVRIETARHEIEGTLQLPHEGFRSRMTDFLNTQGDDFLRADRRRGDLPRRLAREPGARTTYLALGRAGTSVLVVELRRQRRRQAPDRLLDELGRRPDVQPREAGARRAEVAARAYSATRPRSRKAAAGSSPSPAARQSSHAR